MKKIFIYTILFLFISCSSNKKTGLVSSSKDKDATEIKGQILSADSTILSSIVEQIYEDILIMRVRNYSPVYEVCMIKDDQVVKLASFMDEGNGPFRAIYPKCFIDKANQCLYLYGENFNPIYRIPFPLSENVLKTETWERVSMSKAKNAVWGQQYAAMKSIGSQNFLAIGGNMDGNNMFSIISKDTTISVNGYSLPDDGFVGPHEVKRINYLSANLLKHPSDNRYVYVCMNGDYVDIFTLKGDAISDVIPIHSKYPLYSNEDGLNPKYDRENTSLGYFGYATSQYIYLLSSPFSSINEWLSTPNYKGYPSFVMDNVEVYDWDGNFIKKLKLNIPVFTFVVSDDDKYIYATSLNLETDDEAIIRYTL